MPPGFRDPRYSRALISRLSFQIFFTLQTQHSAIEHLFPLQANQPLSTQPHHQVSTFFPCRPLSGTYLLPQVSFPRSIKTIAFAPFRCKSTFTSLEIPILLTGTLALIIPCRNTFSLLHHGPDKNAPFSISSNPS